MAARATEMSDTKTDLTEPVNNPGTQTSPAATVDVTGEVCPMTFVKTRLALERIPPGGILRVLMQGDTPRRNVPRTAAAQGHTVVSMETDATGLTVLLLRRKGPARPA
jgi:tRNA 2-thiouridine synthesizing protein A